MSTPVPTVDQAPPVATAVAPDALHAAPAIIPQSTPPTDQLRDALSLIVEPKLAPIVSPLLDQLALSVTSDVAQAKSLAAGAQDAVQGLITAAQNHEATLLAQGGIIGALQSQAAAHAAQITVLEKTVGSALVKAAVDNAKAIVLILVVGSVAGILAVLIAYLAGSTRAADIVLAIPGGAAALAAGLGLYFRQSSAPAA